MERALAVRTIFGVLAIGLLVISLATVSSKGQNQATAQDNFPKVRLWEYKSLRVDGNARSDEQSAMSSGVLERSIAKCAGDPSV